MEMSWSKLLSTKRLCASDYPSEPTIQIHPFDEDQDVIIFSQPFRRLQAKTQVHPLSDNDHVRTRLTHSLEVGMVGYVLGYKVSESLHGETKCSPFAVGSLVRAACLAHDIGNPPFGHAGEEAIKNWAGRILNDADRLGIKGKLTAQEQRDFASFDGNAQGFRVCTQTENYRWNGGLRLTNACLGSFMKYPWSSAANCAQNGKFGFFRSELCYAEQVARGLGLLQVENDRWSRHPLAWLVEAADDICYRFIDLEDGIEMGSFTFGDYEKLFGPVVDRERHWREGYDQVCRMNDNSLKTSYIRSKVITTLVDQTIAIFVENHKSILEGKFEGELLKHIRDSSLVAEAKKMAEEHVFKHPKKLYLEVAAYEIIGGLLDAFGGACFVTPREDSTKHAHLRTLMGACVPDEQVSIYERLRRVVDFVSGMTDRYALGMYRQIRGITTGSMTPAPLTPQ